MRAGELRHTVTLQSVTESLSSTAGTSETWATVTNGASWPAKVETLSGRERFAADGTASELSHRVELRYRSDITPTTKHRLVWDSRYLNIRSVDDSLKHQGLRVLTCTEEVS